MGFTNKVLARILGALDLPVVDLSATIGGDPKWHQEFIIHLATVLKPAVYVEFGIFKCGLFNRMIPYAGRLIGVDANPEAGRHMTKARNASFVAATTAEFVRRLAAEPLVIDLAFIDADHSKEAVEDDFLGILPFVKPHGVILLHDTHPLDAAATAQERCGNGYLAIERLSRQSDQFEMMTIPVHPGLTVCRKRTAQLAWQENTVRRGS